MFKFRLGLDAVISIKHSNDRHEIQFLELNGIKSGISGLVALNGPEAMYDEYRQLAHLAQGKTIVVQDFDLIPYASGANPETLREWLENKKIDHVTICIDDRHELKVDNGQMSYHGHTYDLDDLAFIVTSNSTIFPEEIRDELGDTIFLNPKWIEDLTESKIYQYTLIKELTECGSYFPDFRWTSEFPTLEQLKQAFIELSASTVVLKPADWLRGEYMRIISDDEHLTSAYNEAYSMFGTFTQLRDMHPWVIQQFVESERYERDGEKYLGSYRIVSIGDLIHGYLRRSLNPIDSNLTRCGIVNFSRGAKPEPIPDENRETLFAASVYVAEQFMEAAMQASVEEIESLSQKYKII